MCQAVGDVGIVTEALDSVFRELVHRSFLMLKEDGNFKARHLRQSHVWQSYFENNNGLQILNW